MKVNYIVANYIGENRNLNFYKKVFKLDPLYFFKQHLKFFEENNLSYVTPTFVFNDDIDEKLKQNILTLNKQNYEIVFRKNGGFSYGIWEEIVEKNLYDFDYFFLIEDDYIPAREDFILQHIKKLEKNVAVVCGEINDSISTGYCNNLDVGELNFPYPAISNALITSESCIEVKKVFGKIFCLNYFNDYTNGHANQIFYCLNFFKLGYKIIDILDEFSSPYFDPVVEKIIVKSGNPWLIQPII